MNCKDVYKSFVILNKLPFFVVTELGIKVVNVPSVSFRVDTTIGVCTFQYKNDVYWFWYKLKSKGNRVEIFAPGVNRRKYSVGSTLRLNEEIYLSELKNNKQLDL